MKPETKRYLTIGGITAVLATLLYFINMHTSQYFQAGSTLQIIGFSFLYDLLTIGVVLSLSIVVGNKITKEPYADTFASSVVAFVITFIGLIAYYFFVFAYPTSFLTHPIADVGVVVLFSLAYVAMDN